MTTISRRTVLGAIGAVAAAPAASVALVPTAAYAADDYASNTALYADPALAEGVDYARRYRRHEAVDGSDAASSPFPDTVVLALHGGGIEPGTSELCLAVAGYHPGTGAVEPAGGPTYDHWMFEGIRASNNSPLHVTATHCDDPVARALTAGARRAVSLHGCTPAQAGLADGTAAVVVGGLDLALKGRLLACFAAAGIQAHDAAGIPALNGDDPANIVNRTLTGGGAQLELTTPLRTAMFTTNTRAQRKNTTTATFWQFVTAVRAALQ
ncbi:poly-gamma-glutamate hydrolase family protein [Dactylosporangium aurantiacum]|uniref:Poly-gamma-glutamate hydrolase family protein n=1 Tax=Dactylosporangium aurantiacum TaxID=35754 RepID=A0A9Q9IDE0_9ACTN|nr:poly-gamma-glutamate hydrolase family protein [Dactylosporangium aurantiacum]MDG6101892.1 poly-gamma-glutamate hydrolase family protein [Dactylosporangium aurantiacum]UWZ52310.1 poly-gamma-glutamate hydrolase family protein [Dactylosporangium aurantiacum]